MPMLMLKKIERARLTDGDAGPFFVEISVSHFPMETKKFYQLKQEDFIAFKPVC